MAPNRQELVTFMQDDSTHAARNPLKDVIKPMNKPKHKPDAGAAARKENRVKKEAALHDDFTVFHENQTKEIKEMAEKHGQKEGTMRHILTNASELKAKRSPSLYQALLHYKGKKMNKGDLAEIREAVKDDPKLQKLSRKKQKKLINALKKHQLTKAMGARSSNRAARLDFLRTTARIKLEIEKLAERTGAIAFCFFTRTNMHDSIDPLYIGSDDALDFLIDILGWTPGDVASKFELWGITRKCAGAGNSLLLIQKDCAKMIGDGLNKILGPGSAVKMQYVRYDREIRAKYEVEIEGWPSNIPFTSPFNISTMFEIQLLHNTLRSGNCYWIAMEDDAIEALNNKLKTVPVKNCARRSDFGTTRSPHKSAKPVEKKAEGPAKSAVTPRKRRRVGPAAGTQVPPMYKSKEFIDSSSEEGSSSSSSDDEDHFRPPSSDDEEDMSDGGDADVED
ncbi:hypothetical protein NP233_g5274 [Leucocoprinus birnbaumii]|uniref:Uncharacterized protein n=1 Tax=Leucocoprinus birnbaumii TaxID=56174 RepID=A0AAD5VUK3_9AGAR|nr:hypothetical protein NP233_g5274 [Leucocoprinus birnbaumii]